LFCVVNFVLFFFVLFLVYPMLQFYLDCPFLIALYVFSLSFIHGRTNVAFESTNMYFTIVPFLACVSELSIIDCSFGFL
jgi:hypothetical protein